MINVDEIVARLNRGESIEDIAAEMTAALNEAEAEKRALDAELAAKEKEEETRVLNAKRVAVDCMLDALCDYFVAAGHEEYTKDIAEIDTDKIVKLLDSSIEMTKSLEKLNELQFPLFAKPKVAKTNDLDKVLGDWLKSYGL